MAGAETGAEDGKQARAKELIRVWKGHWEIENRLHRASDVTYDEDRSQVRAGHIPQVMAAIGNVAISVMRLLGASNIAAACAGMQLDPHWLWQLSALIREKE